MYQVLFKCLEFHFGIRAPEHWRGIVAGRAVPSLQSLDIHPMTLARPFEILPR